MTCLGRPTSWPLWDSVSFHVSSIPVTQFTSKHSEMGPGSLQSGVVCPATGTVWSCGLGPGSWSLLRFANLRPHSGHLALILWPTLPPSRTPPATLEKPTLSLHPPWTTIFKGERVTLRCDGYHPPLLELRPISTLWYSGHLLLPSHKKSIEIQTPGVYRCQTRGAPVSDPIHLSVSNGECLSLGAGLRSSPLDLLALQWERTSGHSVWGGDWGLTRFSADVALCARGGKACLTPKVPSPLCLSGKQ